MSVVRKLIILMLALVLSTGARAAFFGFGASSNETLRGKLLVELRKTQKLMVGEPQYYLLQDFMLQVEAGAVDNPYAWLDQTYEFCNLLQNMYGPVVYHPGTQNLDRMQMLRRFIMQILDFPYHEVSLNNKQATQDGDTMFYTPEQSRKFYEATYASNWQRRLNVSAALKVPLEPGECQVIKVYSSGYIFRTSEHCVAADICYRRCFNTDDMMDELVDAMDILFTSHPHDDHYDIQMWKMLEKSGKPMLFAKDIDEGAPGNKICWMESDERSRVLNYTPGKVEHAVVPLLDGGEVDVTAVHSRQGQVPLLMYCGAFDGWSFLHIADSSDQPTWEAFRTAGCEMPDFVFSPQDAPVVQRIIGSMPNDGARPFFYFTTHENEYEHSVCRRASYMWLLTARHCLGSLEFYNLRGLSVLIDGGESLVFRRSVNAPSCL